MLLPPSLINKPERRDVLDASLAPSLSNSQLFTLRMEGGIFSRALLPLAQAGSVPASVSHRDELLSVDRVQEASSENRQLK